jgi:hypothetical protein
VAVWSGHLPNLTKGVGHVWGEVVIEHARRHGDDSQKFQQWPQLRGTDDKSLPFKRME